MQIRDDDTSEDLVQSLAPMIDVVFLLLIFFMVATTFVEREKEMGIDLPTAQSGEDASFDAEAYQSFTEFQRRAARAVQLKLEAN